MTDQPRRTRRRMHARVALGLGALAATLLAVLPRLPVRAAAPTVPPRRVPAASVVTRTAAPTLSLVDQSATAAGDGTFLLDLQVTDLDTVPAGTSVEVTATVHQRVKTRQAFERTTRGLDLGSVLGLVEPQPVTLSLPGADPTARLAFRVGDKGPSCPECITVAGDGVYPIHVELRERGGERVYDQLTTHLVYAATGAGRPLAVAVVVPLHLTPGTDLDGRDTTPDTSGFVSLVEGLAARPLVPVTIVPTPEAIDTLGLLADRDRGTAGEGAAGLLDLLRAALTGREVLGGPYVRWPTGELDSSRLLPELRRQVAHGRAVLTRRLRTEVDRGTTLIGDRVPSADALEALGTQRLVVPEAALATDLSDDPTTGPALLDPGALEGTSTAAIPVITLDAALQSHLTPARSREDHRLDVLCAQHLLADLAVIHFTDPDARGVAVVVPDGTAQTTLDTLLAGVGADVPTLAASTLSDLFELPLRTFDDGQPIVRLPADTTARVDDPSVTALATAVGEARPLLRAYASLFDDGPAATETLDRRLATAFAADLSPSRRLAHLAEGRAEVERRLREVRLAEPGSVGLTARVQDVPIAVVNDSGRPITIGFEASSDNVRLLGARVTAGSARPVLQRRLRVEGRVARVAVRVATRGPGAFTLVAALRAPTGDVLDTGRYSLRSTAVSGLGKVLSIGSLLFLALWWVRSITRTRRARAEQRRARERNTSA